MKDFPGLRRWLGILFWCLECRLGGARVECQGSEARRTGQGARGPLAGAGLLRGWKTQSKEGGGRPKWAQEGLQMHHPGPCRTGRKDAGHGL